MLGGGRLPLLQLVSEAGRGGDHPPPLLLLLLLLLLLRLVLGQGGCTGVSWGRHENALGCHGDAMRAHWGAQGARKGSQSDPKDLLRAPK